MVWQESRPFALNAIFAAIAETKRGKENNEKTMG